jgi:light-regulated signal transduction histidine kinase (bacteriophytochrome)
MNKHLLISAFSMIKSQFATIFVDISRRKMIEQGLACSNAELEQFANVASYDLHEPVRMVLSHLALLNRKYGNSLEPQAREYVRTAEEGAERLGSWSTTC